MPKKYLAVCLAGLVILSLPRFNLNDPWIIKKIAGEGFTDASQYLNYTLYLKGDESVRDSIERPFTYRFLTPFIASLSPFDPFTSINILNLIYLVSSLILIYKILILLTFKSEAVFAGCLMFGISFPVFWYGTTGNIDPGIIFYSTAGIFAVLKQKWLLLGACFFFGILTKETIVILFPFLFVYFLNEKNIPPKKKYLISLTTLSLVLALYFVIRNTAPGPEKLDWIPSLDKFINNISRIKTYLSLILTLGFPGLLLSLYILKYKLKAFPKIEYALLAGTFGSLALFIYSLFSAYSDGRFIWYTYPFSIPLSVSFITKEFEAGNFKFLRKILKTN